MLQLFLFPRGSMGWTHLCLYGLHCAFPCEFVATVFYWQVMLGLNIVITRVHNTMATTISVYVILKRHLVPHQMIRGVKYSLTPTSLAPGRHGRCRNPRLRAVPHTSIPGRRQSSKPAVWQKARTAAIGPSASPPLLSLPEVHVHMGAAAYGEIRPAAPGFGVPSARFGLPAADPRCGGGRRLRWQRGGAVVWRRRSGTGAARAAACDAGDGELVLGCQDDTTARADLVGARYMTGLETAPAPLPQIQLLPPMARRCRWRCGRCGVGRWWRAGLA